MQKEEWVSHLNGVIVTPEDMDHAGGLPGLLQPNIFIDYIYTCTGMQSKNQVFPAAEEFRRKVISLNAGDSLSLETGGR